MTYINGFYVSASPSLIGVRSFKVPGTGTYLPVRSDIAPLLIGFASEFNRNVQPLHTGWCWGYSYRSVRGYTVPSFHSAGIAIDLNAPIHPLGRTGTFNYRQRQEINRLCKKYGLRWGGNYNGRKDEMHFEIILSHTQALALVKKLQYGTVVVRRADPNIDRMKFGMENHAVLALQKKLKAFGYDLKADGKFGKETRAKVRRFQLRQGWSGTGADGRVGPVTYRKLFGHRP